MFIKIDDIFAMNAPAMFKSKRFDCDLRISIRKVNPEVGFTILGFLMLKPEQCVNWCVDLLIIVYNKLSSPHISM
jgi:hypothetical protein